MEGRLVALLWAIQHSKGWADMAEKKKASKANTNANIARNVVRGFVAVLLLCAIVAAILDFRQKSACLQTQKVVGDAIGNDGFLLSELPSKIIGSPRTDGDSAKDQTVTYRWGTIREYKFTLRFEGQGDSRVVVAMENE